MSVLHTTETFTFEGAVPALGFVNTLGFFHGMTFDNVGALDKNLERHDSPQNGYTADGVGHDLAFTYDGGGNLFHSSGETFSLKAGQFASAWEVGEQATFSAYVGGVLQGSQTVTLNQHKSVVQFGAAFMHIDQVTLSVVAGVPGPKALGGTQLGMDSVRVVWDGGIPASATEPHHHGADMFSHLAHMSGELLL